MARNNLILFITNMPSQRKQIMKLGSVQIGRLFGDKISSYLKHKIDKYNLTYSKFDTKEKDLFMRRIVDVLLDKNITKTGKHRLSQWENGWRQNLREIQKDNNLESIEPRYFGKYSAVRINRELAKPLSKNFERNTLSVIQNWLFDKYLRNVDNVYEFGCGTGRNLLLVRDVNPKAELWGLDWTSSSQKIIRKLAKEGFDDKLFAKKFDFFSPDKKFKLKNKSAVYTVAALEQTGKNYKKFIDYLIENRPKVVIHIEPMAELLDQNNLMDYLSIQYFKKRNYLDGLLDHLKMIEKAGKIKIVKAGRTYLGSLFIDGYSVTVWMPL